MYSILVKPSATRIIRLVRSLRVITALAFEVLVQASRVCRWIGDLTRGRTAWAAATGARSSEWQISGEAILLLCELDEADEVVAVEVRAKLQV